MSPRTMTTFRIDDELLSGLREIAEREGILVPEQVRRAIRLWLESKGVQPKAKTATVRKPRRKV